MSNAMQQLKSLTTRAPRMLSELAMMPLTDDAMVYGMAENSQHVASGEAFICMPRSGDKARQFIRDAKKHGASVALTIHLDASDELPTLALKDQQTLGEVLRRWFTTDRDHATCIGITGTDGKTSIAWMLREALHRHLGSAWACGTLGWVRDNQDIQDLGNTTPSMLTLHRLLAAASDQKTGALVMEVSSHGIEQQRIAGMPIHTAIWSNLGHDHLQDHGGFERYAALKTSFIAEVAAHGTAICNRDCQQVRERVEALALPVHWYSRHDQAADLYWQQDQQGEMTLTIQGQHITLRNIPLGDFHAENIAAVALTLCSEFGIVPEGLPALLDGISAPPGRMQSIRQNDVLVLIDYAHTPEALERCLHNVRHLARGRVLLVFGCGGDRDKQKRPVMGEIAHRLADQIWVTSDNPRSEQPEQIIDDILQGMPANDEHIHIQADRAQAIGDAVAKLQSGDVLLLAGKGHEDYMEVQGARSPWSDMDRARMYLSARFHGGEACA